MKHSKVYWGKSDQDMYVDIEDLLIRRHRSGDFSSMSDLLKDLIRRGLATYFEDENACSNEEGGSTSV